MEVPPSSSTTWKRTARVTGTNTAAGPDTWSKAATTFWSAIRACLVDALIVGQDGILRAGWQPAPAGLFTRRSGGLPTRRRLPTCPTTSAEFLMRPPLRFPHRSAPVEHHSQRD